MNDGIENVGWWKDQWVRRELGAPSWNEALPHMTNEAALAFERDVVIRTAATHDQFAFFYGSPTEFLGEEDYEEDEEVESVEDPQLLAYNESLDELYAFNGSTWQLWNY